MSLSVLKRICYIHLCFLALAASVSVSAQETSTTKGRPANQSLIMGVLAVQSKQDGVLFVDGQRVQSISAGKVATLKVTAGQHFVDLRDQKGNILWQKIVEVPVAAQVAVAIETQKQPQSTELPTGKTVPTGTAGSPASAESAPPPSKFQSEPTAPSPQNAALTIPVGSKPGSLAINTTTNKIYVANRDSITIIDGATNSTSTVAAGTKPGSPVIDSLANKVYVANFASNDTTVIDGATNTVMTIPVGIHPHDPAINSKTSKVYVPNGGSDTVTVIDGKTNKTHSVRVGKSPSAIAVNEATNMIYVACGDSRNLAVIDGTREKVTFVDNVYWEHLAVDPDRNLVYTAGLRMLLDRDEVQRFLGRFPNPWETYADDIAHTIPAKVIDGRSNISRDITREHARSVNPTEKGVEDVTSIVTDPLTHKIYMSIYLSESGGTRAKNESTHVVALDADTHQTQEIMVGSGMSAHLSVDPVRNIVYVANYDSDTISVIDGATGTTTKVPAGKKPGPIAVNPITNRIYVLNEASDSVTILDAAALTSAPK
jgi:YVTN family beta-propeller protein